MSNEQSGDSLAGLAAFTVVSPLPWSRSPAKPRRPEGLWQRDGEDLRAQDVARKMTFRSPTQVTTAGAVRSTGL